MRAFWYGDVASANPHDRNWGDIITPVILKGLTGQNIVRTPKGGGRILAIGSILHRAHPGDLVWGSGIISPKHIPSCASTLKVSAVRGPLTRKLLQEAGADVPEIYGDPALLTPYFFDLSGIPKTHTLGIIPHYNDMQAVRSLASPNVKIIDICAGIEEVLRQVASCENILTSSLHGVVLGDCFAEKTAWLQIADGSGLVGGDFKFKDYLIGTGREPKPTIRGVGGVLTTTINWLPKPQVNLKTLSSVCPGRNNVPISKMPKVIISDRG